MARHGTAYGSRTRRYDAVAGRDCHIAFSLSVEFIDGQAKGTPAPIEQFSAQRFAATGHRAQAVIPARLGFIYGTHHLQRRRRQESVEHAEVLQKLKGALRRKLLEAMRNNTNTMVPSA